MLALRQIFNLILAFMVASAPITPALAGAGREPAKKVAKSADPERISDDEFDQVTHIMKYADLMRLSKADRKKYIDGVRDVVTEFELNQIKMNNPMKDDELTAKFSWFRAFVNEAEANDYNYYSRTTQCPKINNFAGKVAQARAGGATIQCLANETAACASGFFKIGVLHRSRQKVCMSELGYRTVLRNNADRAARASRQSAQASSAAAKAREASRIASSKSSAPAKGFGSAAQRRADFARSMASSIRSPADAERQATAYDTAVAAMDDVVDSSTPQDAAHDVHHSVGEMDAVQIADADTNRTAVIGASSGVRQTDASGVVIQNPATPDQCEAQTMDPPPSCTDDAIAEAKRRYYAAGNTEVHCLYAGNVSHYASREKRPGRCERVTKFCLGSLDCKDQQGQPMHETFKCADTNKVMCSPFLFNVDANNEPFCVAPGKNATLECNKLAPRDRPPFVTTELTKHKGTADTVEASFQGISNSWDEFATTMNQLCFQRPTKVMYCRECQVMKVRLYELNMAIVNPDPTKADRPVCYYFRKIQSLHQTGTLNGPAIRVGTPASADQVR